MWYPRAVPPKSALANKVAHVSIDDVEAFKDLITNANTYNSLFEQPFFAFLKKLHDEYNAAFTLYTYETFGSNGPNIASVPAKFKNEFKEASSWLRIGFHWPVPEFNTDISVENFRSAYRAANSSISRFADTAMVAETLRIHYYYGPDSLIDTLQGVRVLLCADTPGRQSYNLNHHEMQYVGSGKQLVKDSIRYIRTDLRSENHFNITRTLRSMQNRDTLVVFTHEWAMQPQSVKSMLLTMWQSNELHSNYLNKRNFECVVKWLHNNGYRFSFL